jgi:hypothetical protein
MASSVSTSVLTNQDADFYLLIGPFLARRQVVKAVGGPIWDDDGKRWIVAIDGDAVVGFIGLRAGTVESLYTLPGRERLARRLVAAAVKEGGGRPLHAKVARLHLGAYLAAGFAAVSETANFVALTREGS